MSNPGVSLRRRPMAVPDFQSLMRPCLAVHQDRQPHTSAALRDRIAAEMNVSAEDRAIILPSGRQTLFANRVAWAVTLMAQAGLLDRPARGVTQITDRGIGVLTQRPDRVGVGSVPPSPTLRPRPAGSREPARAADE